jgi:hypothetical protein
MRTNTDTFEQILSKLKCKFADSVYISYLKEQYALKGCKDEVDIDELRDYILVMEEKIKLLKYNFKKSSCELEPIRLNKTSIEFFFEKEKFLTECDRKFLEKIL